MICHVAIVPHRGVSLVVESTASTMHYTLKDHQGSLTATVCGNAVERLSISTMRVTLEGGKVFSDKVLKE